MKVFLGICLTVIHFVVSFTLSTIVSMLAWNWFMPHVFPEVPKLTFWMAVIFAFAITGFHPEHKDCEHEGKKDETFFTILWGDTIRTVIARGLQIAILFVIQFLAFN